MWVGRSMHVMDGLGFGRVHRRQRRLHGGGTYNGTFTGLALVFQFELVDNDSNVQRCNLRKRLGLVFTETPQGLTCPDKRTRESGLCTHAVLLHCSHI